MIIFCIGFIIYFQTLFFNFSYLDDNNLILDNAYFLSHLSNIFKSFQIDVFHLFNHSAFYYRPILTISFLIDYQILGISPFIYHFTNVILHLIASSLVFIFLNKLNYKKENSFLFALIFLVHPVLTQAVAWIPGRNDSLITIFVLSTFIYLIHFLKNKRNKYFIYSLIFLLLALFTKETGVFVIIPIIFYLYFINKQKEFKKEKLYYILSSIIITIFWFIVRSLVLQNSAGTKPLEMTKSIFLHIGALIQLTGKILLPFNLSVLPIIKDTTYVYGIITIVLILIVLFYTKQKRLTYIIFGLGWFLIFLLPSFIRPDANAMADFIEHRMYLPLIGFFIFILETQIFKNFDLRKNKSIVITSIILISLSTMTIVHSRNFVNKLSFWENASMNSPDYPLAHRNLGAMYYLDGNLDKAEIEFKKSLELNPQEEMAHNNLGLIYENKNLFDESEKEYLEEIKINPYYDNVYANLGLLYYKQQKYNKAEEAWKKTLSINPGFTQAIINLTILYYQQKKYDEAKPYAKELYDIGYQLPTELTKY